MSQSTEDLIKELESSGVLNRSSALARKAPNKVPSSVKPDRSDKNRISASVWLIVAILIAAVAGSLPFVDLALYPFSLFVTLLHENGHAIASELTGGGVSSITIRPDLSGVTMIHGGSIPIEAPAGYLGASLAGMVLLLTRTRFARWALGVLAAIPILDIVFFHAGDLYTGVWAAAFAAVLGLAAWKLKSRWLAFLQIFLGVEVGLNAFRDLMTLIFISGQGLGMGADADQMSHALFFPSIFWSVLWSIISILMLSTGIYVVVRRDFPQLLMRRRSGEKSGSPRDT